MVYDIVIIGAGVIGCFLARDLAKYQLKVAVLEKNNDVGNETSNANSAIIHSGYDPLPHSLKAQLNVKGNLMYDQICEDLDVKFHRIGSITLAISDEDVITLKELQKRASENNVNTTWLTKEEVLKLEPNVSKNIKAGLLATSAGIIDPFNLCVHLMENAIDNGVELFLNTKVDSIDKKDNIFVINQTFQAKVVINCAGLFADEINEMVNPKSFQIIPRKGEYYVLNHFDNNFVKHTLFLVPSQKGKGVLISPTTSYNYLIGPSAEVCEKEDKDTDKITLNEVKKAASMMIENIPFHQVIRTFAGIRPTPDTHDFIIEESQTKGFINCAGIESPGLASAPAISLKVIQEILIHHFTLQVKENYQPKVRKYICFKYLSLEEKNQMIMQDKTYGELVCRCEQVTKGEILDSLSRSCPPHSIKALKKRLRVGFGKCQGGMCQSSALKILANYYHLSLNEIPYDSKESYILLNELKGNLTNEKR